MRYQAKVYAISGGCVLFGAEVNRETLLERNTVLERQLTFRNALRKINVDSLKN